mgnify:FL=1
MAVINIESTKTLTGAQIIVKTLKTLGVDTIFGYPGGIVLSIYDELFKQNDIKHILVRHEQAAVHAAEGYARVSGKCGVVLVTSGPGAANTVSGIANAYLDGYPLVVLTGQVFSSLIGKNAFQEVNILDITKSCTKAGFQITSAEQIQDTLYKAFNCATSGKKAPVVVDMAKNVFTEQVEFVEKTPDLIKEQSVIKGNLAGVLSEIINAKNPVVIAGGGVVHSHCEKELYNFVKQLEIPVVNTLMSLGTYPQEDENHAGMIGIFGSYAANQTLKESDLILSIGARLNDRITCCFKEKELERKFIQLDINENEISNNVTASDSITGDAGTVLKEMNKILDSKDKNWNFSTWLEHVQDLKKHNKINSKISDKMHSYEVIQKIYEYTKDMDMIVTTEVGQHQLWTAQNYKFKRAGRFLTSGGSGTMGFGFPAAIGASIALDKAPVICIAGDGSFQMNEQELAVCKDYNLPIKIFIINNGYLGMVRQLQQKGFEKRYSETKISNPDFTKLAEAYNIPAININTTEDLTKALPKVFSENTPYIINCNVEPMEIV